MHSWGHSSAVPTSIQYIIHVPTLVGVLARVFDQIANTANTGLQEKQLLLSISSISRSIINCFTNTRANTQNNLY